ncbi:MAG: DUF87 domain-containing protein, partial [Ghiorsea sp.]|nr:DUF87 domain-containing protein [Ghiorsea sp.]
MAANQLHNEAILRVGEVIEVNGRQVFVEVDKNKNLSELFYNGEALQNISVNSYIEIRKGFLSLIGKVDGERIKDASQYNSSSDRDNDRNKRILSISLSGFLDKEGRFVGGTKELPLIGNEAFLLTSERNAQVHNLVGRDELSIQIAQTDLEGFRVSFPVDGLFNSHIAIFGNTGSGKSNTLASLYQALFIRLSETNQDAFRKSCRYLFFDFNGEYSGENCLTNDKAVFNLSTRLESGGDKLPISEDSLLDIEMLSVLADATEKTQKPFLKRAIKFYQHVHKSSNSLGHFKNILRQRVTSLLQMSDKVRADLILDYFRGILPEENAEGIIEDIGEDLDWHNTSAEYMWNTNYLKQSPDKIPNTAIYQRVAQFEFGADLLTKVIYFLYLQLISDILTNRAQNEHIAPAINKLKSKRKDIDKVFDTQGEGQFWGNNVTVINLNDVNLDMRKTIPLLVSKKVYADHKREHGKTLNIIIDEAHHILSTASFREAESWKDYRLE